MSSYPDNVWTDSEDGYALVDRKLLIGSHYFSFTDEFKQLVGERLGIDLDNTTNNELRVNQPLIALLEEYGVAKAAAPVINYDGNPTTPDIQIIDLPAGYTWKVMVDDGYDYDYSMTFVWKEFTMALLNDNDEHPLVNAYKEGRLVGVKEGEPRLIEDLTGDDE
jgi:hypothetical protein